MPPDRSRPIGQNPLSRTDRAVAATRGRLALYESVCTSQKLKFQNEERDRAPGVASGDPSSTAMERPGAKSGGVSIRIAIRTRGDAHTQKDERVPRPSRAL